MKLILGLAASLLIGQAIYTTLLGVEVSAQVLMERQGASERVEMLNYLEGRLGK